MNVLIGVDVGATTIAGGLVTSDGEVLCAETTPTHNGPGTLLERVFAVIARAMAQAARRHVAVEGIGLGLAGVVDVDRGTMISELNHWTRELANVPLAREIRGVTGVPTFVDNDANALALGEWRFGVGRGLSSMVLLAIGTNIGGGIILNGDVVRGASGYAGELAHMSLKPDGPPCVCGARGCLNGFIGGLAIAEEGRRRAERDGQSRMLALAGGDPAAITAATVFAAATGGDPTAAALVDEACGALAATLASIVNGLNPELIVVTGGVATSLVALEKIVTQRVARLTFAQPFAVTRFSIVPGDKKLTVRGGAALAVSELERRSERSRR